MKDIGGSRFSTRLTNSGDIVRDLISMVSGLIKLCGFSLILFAMIWRFMSDHDDARIWSYVIGCAGVFLLWLEQPVDSEES